MDRFTAEKNAHMTMLRLLVEESTPEQAEILYSDLMEQARHAAKKFKKSLMASVIAAGHATPSSVVIRGK